MTGIIKLLDLIDIEFFKICSDSIGKVIGIKSGNALDTAEVQATIRPAGMSQIVLFVIDKTVSVGVVNYRMIGCIKGHNPVVAAQPNPA